MIGKRLILLLFVFVNVQISHATIWYGYQYDIATHTRKTGFMSYNFRYETEKKN